jgi:hypothetical protein
MEEREAMEKGKGIEKEDVDGMVGQGKHLEGMKLQGEDEDDLDFSEEYEELVREVRWLALFRERR